MGLLSGLLGNASEVDVEKLSRELEPVIVDGEQIQAAFQVIRDMFIFTDKRLILIDKQGMTGKKVEYHSIPYRAVTHFSVETAGHFDMDSELKIWVSSTAEPVSRQFKKGSNLAGIQKTLARFVLK